jgi:hypothetical protein
MNRRKRLADGTFAEGVRGEGDTAQMSSEDLSFEQECWVQCERLRTASPEIFALVVKILSMVKTASGDVGAEKNDHDMDEKHFFR